MHNQIGSLTAVAPFPAVDFRSYEEFEQYFRETRALTDLRWRYEQTLATTDKFLLQAGTCGLCLVPTTFTAATEGGERVAAGRVANWRETMQCDCEHRLINRERALLHFALASGALQPWMRVISYGQSGGLRPLLRQLSMQLVEQSDPNDAHRADAHLVLWVETLHRAPSLPAALAAVAARLHGGGRFVFSAPFHALAPVPPADRPVGAAPLGWTVLQMLQQCGFCEAKASLFWSEEFGYLGPFNFLFSAVRAPAAA